MIPHFSKVTRGERLTLVIKSDQLGVLSISISKSIISLSEYLVCHVNTWTNVQSEWNKNRNYFNSTWKQSLYFSLIYPTLSSLVASLLMVNITTCCLIRDGSWYFVPGPVSFHKFHASPTILHVSFWINSWKLYVGPSSSPWKFLLI